MSNKIQDALGNICTVNSLVPIPSAFTYLQSVIPAHVGIQTQETGFRIAVSGLAWSDEAKRFACLTLFPFSKAHQKHLSILV